jgi:hypothetical protein
MTAILRRPEASGRVGLLGFSLGGAAAVASARDRRVGAAVIFYEFVPDDDRPAQPDHLPPLLVLHGSADMNVALDSGREIARQAHRLGGQADLVIYPDEGHRLSTWKEPAARDALSRTISFFRTELIGQYPVGCVRALAAAGVATGTACLRNPPSLSQGRWVTALRGADGEADVLAGRTHPTYHRNRGHDVGSAIRLP